MHLVPAFLMAGTAIAGEPSWTWVKGPDAKGSYGIYGAIGVPDPDGTPGSRKGAVSWTDAKGRLWLFGGCGYYLTPENYGQPLNDLWRYDPATQVWTCLQGVDFTISYGNNGTSATASRPEGKVGAARWIGKDGKIWIFGGGVGEADNRYLNYNDLWSYDPNTGKWILVKGTTDINQLGVYGKKSTASSANIPGARRYASAWTASDGKLWLFGGEGGHSEWFGNKYNFYFNDLWCFDPATNNWTWVKGSDQVDQDGIYGTRGTPGSANTPPALAGASAWTGRDGRFWFFGGGQYGGGTFDLWRFDPVTTQWTWIKSGNLEAPMGHFGTLGVASPDNYPPLRYNASAWSDSLGRFYLFGGVSREQFELLNDLWRYDPATGNWTWLKGSDSCNQKIISGNQGVAASANTPGAREDTAACTDTSGHLWLFGGLGFDAFRVTPPDQDILNEEDYRNDLWRYDVAANNWTWIGGSIGKDERGVFGSRGTAASTNIPGARQTASSWTDKSGRLWLFGGEGFDALGNGGYNSSLNDLWRFDPVASNWTWIRGSDSLDQSGVYGTRGVAAITNTPGARESAVACTGADGRLWLFGGFGRDDSGYPGFLDDLWLLDPATGVWTWIDGRNNHDQETLPLGARRAANGWAGADGRLWIFGGDCLFKKTGQDTTIGYNNALWSFEPVSRKWTRVRGSDSLELSGFYGVRGAASSAAIPGARIYASSWTDKSGRLWLFGGYGHDESGAEGLLNDLWRFEPLTNSWTWIAGSTNGYEWGTYGKRGVASPANTPGARAAAVTWTDAAGNLWLFGGFGVDPSTGDNSQFNDLWQLNPAKGQWAWMGGSDFANATGRYGTRGLTSPDNISGGRSGAVGWVDRANQLWLFGGMGYDSQPASGWLADLWRLNISANAVTDQAWMKVE